MSVAFTLHSANVQFLNRHRVIGRIRGYRATDPEGSSAMENASRASEKS